jgi:ubiquinone/menaquinone biosynthesis C-methylase UbiE
VVEALPLRAAQVFLDVGYGSGLYRGLLQDKVGPDGTVIGIEESPTMAAVAREHVAREAWRSDSVRHASADLCPKHGATAARPSPARPPQRRHKRGATCTAA